jgi:hypothetical protein
VVGSPSGSGTQIMKRAIRSGKVRGAVPLKTVTIRLLVPDLETVRDLTEREAVLSILVRMRREYFNYKSNGGRGVNPDWIQKEPFS